VVPTPRRIDAHQHFWRLARGDYGWLTPTLAPIYRDFGPQDLAPLLEQTGIEETVLVQAAPTLDETRFLLEVAGTTPFVAGVVGWAPLDAPEAAEIIAALAREPALKGVRPMIHDIPNVDWMLEAPVGAALRNVEACGLTLDALVRPPHLRNLLRLLARHPALRVVIDHGGKPEIGAGRFDDWAAHMRALARETAAWVKLSGLVTEAGPNWSVSQLRPYVEYLLEHFGPHRVIFGSDWPVLTLAGGYGEWLATAEALLAGLEPEARARVMGLNAVECYRL